MTIRLIYILIVTSLVQYSFAQSVKDSGSKMKPLFRSNEILHLRMEADYKTIFENKDDTTYFPALLTYTDNDSIIRSVEIGVRTRGKTRRKKVVCAFTPLRLKFSKEQMNNSVFKGQSSIKLVTHCRKKKIFEQNTVIEYLVYRMYNILTDSSFRVRPALINYVFKNRKKKDSIQKFAFFIERHKHLAKRLHGKRLDSLKLHPKFLEDCNCCLLDMFQYMIGNTDYSSFALHNIKLVIDTGKKTEPIAIPYDFDWSGIIYANYATPRFDFELKDVRERLYRGFIKPREIVDKAIARFNLKKTEIYKLVSDCTQLRKSEKNRVLNYLDEFYKVINDERSIKSEFMDKARVNY